MLTTVCSLLFLLLLPCFSLGWSAAAAGAQAAADRKKAERDAEIKALEAQLSRMGEVVVSSNEQRHNAKVSAVQHDRQELERRLGALRLEAAKKEEEQKRLLLAVDEQDRRNYRSYWQARLAFAAENAGDSSMAAIDPVVRNVLTTAGLLHLGPIFAEHRVDAVVLRILTAQDLEKMGISAVGDQKKLLSAISVLFS